MPTISENAAFANLANFLRDGTLGSPGAPVVPSGWVLIAADNNDNLSGSGGHYYGYAFQNQQTGQVIVASAGLDKSNPTDFNQAKQIAFATPPQAELTEAAVFVAGVIRENPGSNASNLFVTGASEGGYVTQVLAAQFQLNGVTFGAPGAQGAVPVGTTANVLNFVARTDFVGIYGPHVGDVIYFGPAFIGANSSDNFTPDNSFAGVSVLAAAEGFNVVKYHYMQNAYIPVMGLETGLSAPPTAPGVISNSGTSGIYYIQSGDTWQSVASQYGISASLLMAMNFGDTPGRSQLSGFVLPVDPNALLPKYFVLSTPTSVANAGSTPLPLTFSTNSGDPRTAFIDSQTGQVAYGLWNFQANGNQGDIRVVGTGGDIVGVFTPNSFGNTTFQNGKLGIQLDRSQTQILFNQQSGFDYQVGGTTQLAGNDAGGLSWNGSDLIVPVSTNSTGTIGKSYNVDSSGLLTPAGFTFTGVSSSTSAFTQTAGDATATQAAIDIVIPPDAQSGAINNSLLTTSVQQLNLIGQAAPSDGGATGSVVNNQIAGSGGSGVFMPGQGVSNNVADTWSTSIGTGNTQPGWERILSSTSDLTLQTGILNLLSRPSEAALASGLLINDTATNGLSVVNVDPLLIDLTGAGVDVSNWISNKVYFDTGVKNDGSFQADGLQHHTSWATSGTGILALDLNGDGKIDDITETISEFFKGGPTPGHYADGLAALASLAQAGATVFSAATSLIDPATHNSYWSELVVWNDANQNGVTDPGELQTLSQLGITSISLVGSGNVGEAINGSAVTNRTTYNKKDGTLGQAAAVNFQTDVAGDITTTASGGVVINSLTEGGPTQTTTFVAQNTTAHTYSIVNGKLTDTTTGTVIVPSGITAVLSSSQNDVISVAATDTNTYWLGGGTGADTLTGGGGTNVFLVNPTTVVHGGTGANSFNIAKVIGTQGVNIDLAHENLQEVIGGPGGSVFNASGTTWNVFIQATSGNNIIIGGAATDALSGGTGDDLIELGAGGGVVHAGQGNDVIYGGSGATLATQPSYVNAGASSNAAYVERLFNGALGKEADLASFTADVAGLNNSSLTQTALATAILNSTAGQAIYGSMSNTQFVNGIFQGLLGRAPNTSELNSFVLALNGGQTRGVALQTVAVNAQSQTYWGGKHPGASDVIFAGPGDDIVTLGANNSEVYDGSGNLTVIGNPDGFSVVGFHGSYADYTLTRNADGTVTVTNINNMDGDGTVTMKNVTDLDFKDISQVPLANAAGMPANDYLSTADTTKVTTNASGQYVIAASTLLANDIDYAGKTLSIRELLDTNGNAIARGASGQVNGGTAALSADGATITFTPTANFNGVPGFRYHVVDSSSNNGAVVQQVGTTNNAEMTATVYLNTPNLPTDPLFDSEWYLQAADVIPVWKDYTGAGVKVAVFDPSGNVDFSNPDLAASAGTSTKIDGTPGVERIGTHATLVAGVIGAARDGVGAVGVSYGATISSEALPTDAFGNLNNLHDWKKYDVVNNSWTFSPPFIDNFLTNPSYQQAYIDAVTQGRGGLGTVLVVAGGNERAQGRTTEDLNETNSRYGVTVGGINAASDLGSLVISGLPFSNPGASILVSAPANNITSTGVTYTNEFGQQFGANYQTTQGTSFATPIVSGIVAMMLQANPTLGYRDVQQILAYSAVKVDPTDATWSFNGATNWNGGGLHVSEDYGYGEVDARAAVRLAATWQTQNTAANEASVNIHQGTYSSAPGTATPLNFAIPIDQGASTQTINLTFPTTPASELRVEHVVVEVNLIGVRVSDLVIKLISPTGETSVLANRPATGGSAPSSPQNFDFTFDSVKDWGEISGGTWKLEVAYAAGTVPVGTVAGVNATIYGSPVVNASNITQPQTFIYTDEYAQLAGGTRSTLQDANGTSDSINVAATTGAVTLDLNAGSIDSTIDGKALTFAAGTHVDRVYLGDGTSVVHSNSDADTFVAGTGNDTIYGGSGTSTFLAGGTNGLPSKIGTDTFIGGSAGNTFFLGNGAANVTGGTIAFGSSGTNLVDFQFASSGVSINLATGVNGGAAAHDTLTNIQSIYGSNFDDTIGGWGGVTLDGGAGTNTLDYSAAPALVVVDFSQGTAQVGTLAVDSINNFQRVIGSSGNDYFFDGSPLSSVDGGAGSNSLDCQSDPNGISLNLAAGTGVGGFGNQMSIKNIQLVAGALYHSNTVVGGNDTQYISVSVVGGDKITANSANTQVSFRFSSSPVSVNLASGIGTVGGASLSDSLTNVDLVEGSAYNDTLVGNGTYSGLDGYLGNDTLTGGGGYDVYYFAQSATVGMNDIVYNGTGTGGPSGEIAIGMGLAPSNIWFSRAGNDLVVTILGTTSQMTVKNWFTSASAQLQRIVAGDGSQIGTSAISQLEAVMASYQASHPSFNPQTATVMPVSLQGWGGGVATGTSGNDTLDPGIGNTTLYGNGGSDIYEFRAGYGADVIVNGLNTNSGPTGALQLSAGLDPSNLWFSRSGNDLVIQVLNAPTYFNAPAQMKVSGWFANGYSQLQSLVLADGSQISTSAITALATAMTAFQISSGFNPQTATAMPTALAVRSALTANWSRTITSSANNATLNAIYGSDTLIATGTNNTLIVGLGNDTLTGGPGIDTAVFSGKAADYSIKTTLAGVTTITDTVAGRDGTDTLSGIEFLRFADTTLPVIIALPPAVTGTNGADRLYGTSGAEVFDGKGGNDYVFGGGGGDSFVYNGGYGQLEIDEHDTSASPNNVLQMTGTTSANVTVLSDGANLYLTDGLAGDLIKIDNFASGQMFGVQTVQFADTTWHAADLQSRIKSPILGSPTASDTLVGTSSADYFDGRGAPAGQTDVLTGGGGNDIFTYNRAYGSLEINENGASGDRSILKLGPTITLQTITIQEDAAGNLILLDGVAGDQVKLDNYFNGATFGPQVIQFADGTFLTKANVVLGPPTHSWVPLTGAKGANYIDGQGVASGGYTSRGGNDVFIYNKGYHGLQINEVNAPTTPSLLKFGAGITESDVYLSRGGSGFLTITLNDGTVADNGKAYNDGSDGVQLPYFLNPTTGSNWLGQNWGPQTIQFADGATLSRDQLLAMYNGAGAFAEMLVLQGTSGNVLPSTASGVFSQTLAQAASHTVAVTAYGGASAFTFILDERNVQVKNISTSGNSLFVTEQGGTVDTFTYSGTVGTVSNLAWMQTSPGIYAVMAGSTGTTLNPYQSTANAGGTGTVSGANVTYAANTFVNSSPYQPLRTANDVFFFNGVAYRDTVTDFHAGDTAVFDLSAFDAGTASVSLTGWGTPAGVSGAAQGYYALVTGKVNGTVVSDWLYFQNLAQEQNLQLTQVSPTAVQVAVSATLTPVNGVVTCTTSTSDIMTGDSQADTFMFSGLKFGNDTITNLKAGDQVQIDLSTTPLVGAANVLLQYNADPTRGAIGDYVFVQGNAYYPGNDNSEFDSSSIYFGNVSNGQLNVQSTGNNHWTVSLAATPTYTWVGGAANPTLTGSNYGNNTFQFGGGAETATGGRLANIYQASSATGQAQINLPSAAGAQSELDFKGALSDESLWFVQSGNDLTIDLLGTSSNVTVKNFFGTSGSQMQEITAGGLKLDSGVSQLVQAMAAYSSAHSGFSPTASAQVMPIDATLQNTIAAAWHA